MANVNKIFEEITKLSESEQKQLKNMLTKARPTNTETLSNYVSDKRFKDGYVCPHCGSTHLVKNGKRQDKTQRYLCRDCNKSALATSNSIVSFSKKGLDVWEKYIDCMMCGLSIRKSAEVCGINRNTAFAWRHKILDALAEMTDQIVLDGIVEADETFFHISYKGNHKNSKKFVMPRKAHVRGNDTHTRGLSKEQVCVPCAVNRHGLSYAKITNTGRVSRKDISLAFDNRLDSEAILITDKNRAYNSFANDNNIELVQIKKGKHKKGIYHTQHINNYHQQLKQFMKKFNGVSTKYLSNYIAWNNLINFARHTFSEKRRILQSFCMTIPKTVLVRELSSRPALPFAA